MVSNAAISGGDSLKGFMSWWIAQLRDCLPPAWRTARRHSVTVGINADGTVDDEALAALALPAGRGKRQAQVKLALPPGAMLSRRVLVPAAAASDALGLLAYEFDRLTPFRAEDTAWTAYPLAPTASGASTAFLLLLAPRFTFERALRQAEEHGLSPAVLVGEDEGGTPIEIPLLRATARPRRAPYLAFAAACLALIVAPFGMQLIALMRIDSAITALAPAHAQADALRQDINAYTAGPAAVAREQKSIGDIMGILKSLTDTLPDDTFLTGVGVRDRRVTAQGETREAPQLIGLLEHRAGFSGAAFSGPVTHSADTNTDAFTITATVPN